MTLESVLAVLIYALVPFAWVSTGVLVYAANQKPRIGALTERAAIAVIIAVLLTSIAILVFNTENDRALFDVEIARVVFRVCVLLLGLVPVAWVVLWLTGRLGASDGP